MPLLDHHKEIKSKEMKKPKYNPGDKVQIVKYGHLICTTSEMNEKGLADGFPVYFSESKLHWIDINPELIGKKGVINYSSETQGIIGYVLTLENGNRISWLHEPQLILIKKK